MLNVFPYSESSRPLDVEAAAVGGGSGGDEAAVAAATHDDSAPLGDSSSSRCVAKRLRSRAQFATLLGMFILLAFVS